MEPAFETPSLIIHTVKLSKAVPLHAVKALGGEKV
jgi:hypothetical protein